jgi:CheY-like chemotaxis protein
MAAPAPLILLVDDDVDFVEMNRHVLEARGYRVAAAHDPAEALKLMADQPPDLVITDLMMRDLDSGFAFARQIREDPRAKETPVIIVTSVTSQLGFDFRPRTPEDLAAMHVDAYFDKPVAPQVLLDKVKTLLERH